MRRGGKAAGFRSRWLPRGPGMLVAAAFVGPGTVTTCSLAGARYGTDLLWALLLSLLALVVLQEMSARLGVLGRTDLARALRDLPAGTAGRALVILLVLVAVGFGSAAYQVGNLVGGGLGLATVAGGDYRWWSGLCAAIAAGVLWAGGYRLAARVLSVVVALMGICFLATAVAVAPSIPAILRGLLVPSVGADRIGFILALVGTTVVPYNLFLHAVAARHSWSGEDGMASARRDLVVSIGAGGVVSAAILITGAGVLHGSGATGVEGLVLQLEPVLGSWGRHLFGIGLFAAGFSSAMTAPMAAAAAVTGLFGRDSDPRRPAFRAVWATVLGIGTLFALLGRRPVRAILLAQGANGLLLPFAAAFLLLAMNDAGTLGRNRNGRWSNLGGIAVVGLVAVLGLAGLARAIRGG